MTFTDYYDTKTYSVITIDESGFGGTVTPIEKTFSNEPGYQISWVYTAAGNHLTYTEYEFYQAGWNLKIFHTVGTGGDTRCETVSSIMNCFEENQFDSYNDELISSFASYYEDEFSTFSEELYSSSSDESTEDEEASGPLTDEMIEDITEGAMEAKDYINEADPTLRDDLTTSFALNNAGSTLDAHILKGIADYALGDSEIAEEAQEFAINATLKLFNWLLTDTPDPTLDNDEFYPIEVSDDCALLRSWGSLYEMDQECYSDVNKLMNSYVSRIEKYDNSWVNAFCELTDASTLEKEARRKAVEDILNNYIFSVINTEQELYSAYGIYEAKDGVYAENPAYVYQLTDASGNILFSLALPEAESVTMSDDGKIVFTFDSGMHDVVIDKEGNILYDSLSLKNGGIQVYGYSSEGTMLELEAASDFENGDHYVLYFVDASGKRTEINTAVDDFNLYSGGYTDVYNTNLGYINMKTGEITEEAPESDQEQNIGGNYRKLNDSCYFSEENGGKLLTPDSNGELTEAADLSSGQGVMGIDYYDGYYWVLSNTGYYYILDENFETVLEPVCVLDDELKLRGSDHEGEVYYLNSSVQACPYGIVIHGDSDITEIWDMNGEKVYTEYLDQTADKYIFGTDSDAWYNLNSGDSLRIDLDNVGKLVVLG